MATKTHGPDGSLRELINNPCPVRQALIRDRHWSQIAAKKAAEAEQPQDLSAQAEPVK